MKHLLIVGTGAFARELYWNAQKSIGFGSEWDIKGFLDGDVKVSEEEYAKLDKPVLGNIFDYEIMKDDVFTCAVGTPDVRKKLIDTIVARGGSFINIIHNTAIIQGHVVLGKGIVISPFCFINDHAKIDDYVMLNCRDGLGHDVEVGKYTCLMGYVELCGFVKVGELAYFGSGSRVLPHGKIGDNAFVGAGSVVIKKVKENDKVFGNPAISIL